MIPAADKWGPFTAGIEAHERTARCRCLRAVVHLMAGSRGAEAERLLSVAERDPAALSHAAAAINAMPPIDKRHIWASYAALSRPV